MARPCRTAVMLLALLVAFTGVSAVRADDKQVEIDKLRKKLEATHKRITELEETVKKLTTGLEEHRRLLLQAQNAEKLARKEAQLQAKRFEQQLELMEKLYGDSPRPKAPIHPALPRVDPRVPPAKLHGAIVDVVGDLVTINIGIDAGLTMGSVLDVYRLNGERPRYLGTIKITDAFNLYPKQAVMKFTPARKAALKDLKPDELPKKGDVVRPVKQKD